MYGDGIDMDSPPVHRKKKDPFQAELHRKLKDRKSRGLSADITSPEEESDDDGLGGDDDFLSQYTTPHKRADRPTSAKHRAPPLYTNKNPHNSRGGSDWNALGLGLGDTMRPGVGGAIFGRNTLYNDDDDDNEDEANYNATRGFGKDKKDKKSPMTTPRLVKGQQQQQPGKPGDRKLSKEDIIFGRKGTDSSPRDSKSPRGIHERDDNRPWQPPSFRKSTLPETEASNRSTSPASSKGRKTPSSDLLEPINETPTPRARRFSQKDDKMKSQYSDPDDSPRPQPKPRGKVEEKTDPLYGRKTPTMPSLSGRKTPTSEISGRKTPPSEFPGRKTPTSEFPGRKTPTSEVSGRMKPTSELSGRKTPTSEFSGRKTPPPEISGRKTSTSELFGGSKKSSERKAPATDIFGKSMRPSELIFSDDDKDEIKKTPTVASRRKGSKPEVRTGTKFPVPASRKTPTSQKEAGVKGRRGSSPESPIETNKKDDLTKRRTSLMDFMTEEAKEDKSKQKQTAKTNLHKSESRDSITEEFRHSRSTYEETERGRPHSRGSPKLRRGESPSSICDDTQADPNMSTHVVTDGSTQELGQRTSGPQRSDKQRADEAINSVAHAQEDLTMQFIESDDKQKEKDKNEKKTPGTRTPKQKPKPRYASKPGEETPPTTPNTFEDTMSIRNAIYAEWYKERTRKAKEILKKKKKIEAEEEVKKAKAEEDKIFEAKASYSAWMEKKQDTFKDKVKQQRMEERKKEKELEEKETKKKEADKTFSIWKERKESIIKETTYKEKKAEMKITREITHVKRDKEDLNKSAYVKWKKQKDAVIKSKMKEEHDKEKGETLKEKQTRKTKEIESMTQYEDWMRKKEIQEEEQAREERRRKLENHDEPKPAWSPANRTIPFGR